MPVDLLAAQNQSNQPRDLFAESGMSPVPAQPVAQQSTPIGLRALQDIAAGLSAGGQGIHNAPYNLARSFAPGLEKYMPAPTNLDTSAIFGVKNPNILDKLVQGGAQYAPYAAIGGASLLGQLGSSALAGATQGQNPRVDIPAYMAATGLGVGALKGAGTLGRGLLGSSASKTLAEALSNNISKGANLGENAVSAGNRIINGFNNAKQVTSDLYNTVSGVVGNQNIYPSVISKEAEEPRQFLSKLLDVKPNIIDKMRDDSELSTSLDNFQKNTSFDNAHILKSDILKYARSINVIPGVTPSSEIASRDAMNEAAANLNSDMEMHLSKSNPGMLDAYRQASDYYKENLLPYYTDRNLRNLVKGEYTDSQGNLSAPKLKNVLNSIIKAPEATDIRAQVGPELDRELLYSQIGNKLQSSLPKDVSQAIDSAGNKGLDDYLSPEIMNQKRMLDDAMAKEARNKKIAKWGAGLGAAAGLGGVPLLKHFL